MPAKKEAPPVKVGQVWLDNDRRSSGNRAVRVVKIVKSIDPATGNPVKFALCEEGYLVGGRHFRAHEKGSERNPKMSRPLRVDRFRPTSTGFRFVYDEKDRT